MVYNKTTAESFTFSPGQWSFASPQKKLSGFSFTITDVVSTLDPITTSAENQYVFKGGLEFIAKINIGSENSKIKISGDTKIALKAAIESAKYTETGASSSQDVLVGQLGIVSQSTVKGAVQTVKQDLKFLAQLKPKYLGVQVKSINIDVTTPAVKIKGSVEFYRNDITYGNGFKGNLEAKFTTPKITIQAGAIFGNTKYIPNNTGGGFKYWMVQAQVGLPAPGIAFIGALAIRGFGAGVYSKMRMVPPTTFSPTQSASSTFAGAVFIPTDTVNFGFKAKVIIATTPKEETFNGSAALAAEFNNQGGINFINFEGLFNCGAKIGEENKAFANGQLLVGYNFPTKVFEMNVKININKDPIATPTPADIRLYINGKTNKWYFKAGVPNNPMWVKVNTTDIQAYLMFGNDLGSDIPTGFMQKTRDGFTNLGYSLPNFNETSTSDNKIKSGKGFALGIGVAGGKTDKLTVVDFYGNVCDCRRYVDINYSIIAGGEINASFLQYANCEGLGKGWRAKVGLAVYAGADVSYSYSLPIVGSGSGTLIRAKASAYAIAEFPKTSYIKGEVWGNYEIQSYSGSLYKQFEIGTQCAGLEETTTSEATYTQQNAADDLDYSLIKNIITPGTDNVSRTSNFVVDLNYPYNKSFDIEEQQVSGELKVRTFRANYTVTLTQDSSSLTTQTTSANQNLSSLTPANTINQGQAQTTTNLQISNNTNQTKSNSGILTNNSITLYPKGVDMYGAQQFYLSNSNINIPALKANTSYKFKIIGKLEENINGTWAQVKKKNTNTPIMETKQMYFKTNADAVGNTQLNNTTTPNSNLKKF